MTAVARFLSFRWASLFFGGLSTLLLGMVWGSLRQIPTVHDEAAYVLQARLFSSGRWCAPARPLPEFFEQFHVLVTPVLASKYPPGHSLLLTPGVWLGLPGLIPLLSCGVTGGLLFALARRVTNAWIALLCWLLWMLAPGVLRFLPSYLSETTTGALGLGAWWALLRWKETGRRAWLLTLSACVGWGAITRPFTMLAFAIPIAVVVARLGFARRAFGDLALALLLGAAVLGILPLWSAQTTGSWRITPLSLYTRTYLPFDVLGFRDSAVLPRRPLPAELKGFERYFRRVHREHTPAALPGILADRLAAIFRDSWGAACVPFLAFAVIGALVASAQARFALATAGLLVFLYLFYAHPPGWTVYYLEVFPVLAFLTALGLWAFLVTVTDRLRSMREAASRRDSRQGRLAVSLLAAVLVGALCVRTLEARSVRREGLAYHQWFQGLLATIPEKKAIVFVRHSPDVDVHRSLVVNEPDLSRAAVWFVHDRGPENVWLRRLVPDRTAYLFDPSRRRLVAL